MLNTESDVRGFRREERRCGRVREDCIGDSLKKQDQDTEQASKIFSNADLSASHRAQYLEPAHLFLPVWESNVLFAVAAVCHMVVAT